MSSISTSDMQEITVNHFERALQLPVKFNMFAAKILILAIFPD